MAQAFDHGLLAMREHCAARRVNPRMRFATQIGTLVIMPRDEGLQCHEEDVFLDGLPPLSSSTSQISSMARKCAKKVCVETESAKQTTPGLVREALVCAFSC